MPQAQRGEIWLIDLGMVQKPRPSLVLSIAYLDHERAVVSYGPRTRRPSGCCEKFFYNSLAAIRSNNFTSSNNAKMFPTRSGGKHVPALAWNFFTSNGMPSARRRRWPTGYSTSTFSVALPSGKKICTGVGNGAFVRFEIFAGVARVFTHDHFGAEGVNPRIGGGRVLVMVGRERAKDEADGGHILQTMIAIRRVVQRPGLVNDAEGRFVRVNLDALDLIEAFQWSAHVSRPQRPRIFRRWLSQFVRPLLRLALQAGTAALRKIFVVQLDRSFDGGLRVELGGEGNLEQNIFHYIRAEWSCEF